MIGLHLDRPVKAVHAGDVESNERRAAPRYAGVLVLQFNPEARRRPAQHQVIAVAFAPEPPHVRDPGEIFSVGRHVKRDARILGHGRSAVVIGIGERGRRHPPRGKHRPGRMDLDLVHRLIHRMMLGRGLEHPHAQALLIPENRVIVRISRQRLNATQLAAEENVIIDGQVVPSRQPDARGRRRMIAKRHLRLIHRPQNRARNSPARRIEDLDNRVHRRAEPAAKDLDDDPLALPGPEAIIVNVAVVADVSGNASGNAQFFRPASVIIRFPFDVSAGRRKRRRSARGTTGCPWSI